MSESEVPGNAPEPAAVPEAAAPQTSAPAAPEAPRTMETFFGRHHNEFVSKGTLSEAALGEIAGSSQMSLADARTQYNAYRAERQDVVNGIYERAGGQEAWRSASEWFKGAPEEAMSSDRKTELANAFRSGNPQMVALATDAIMSAYKAHAGSSTVGNVPQIMRDASTAPGIDMDQPDPRALLELRQSNPEAFMAAVEAHLNKTKGVF